MKYPISGACALMLYFASSLARAQPFGARGQLVVSAEQLAGVTHSIVALDSPATSDGPQLATASGQTDSINLLSTQRAAAFNAPRVAFDYFLFDHWSLGGAANYSGVAQVSGGAVGLVARAGYSSLFTPRAGIWARAGINYQGYGGILYPDAHFVAITLEAPFVISPAPRVAFTVGPTLNLGVAGGAKYLAPTRVSELGLQAGLLVYLL